MPQLSEIRADAVRRLIRQMPDGALRTLETALYISETRDPKFAAVQDLVDDERRQRTLGAAVLAPLTLPAEAATPLWAALRTDEAALVAEAAEARRRLRGADPPVFDDLCRRAAARLRARDGEAFTAFAAALDAAAPGAALRLADRLDLAPAARALLPRLQTTVERMSKATTAAIRLAYKDLDAVGADLAPAFTEMLAAHLDHPRQVLRLISAVMDRPTDRYLAGSEMAPFGERLMADLDKQVEAVRRFDPATGVAGGEALAEGVGAAVLTFEEFDQWIAVNREGPWGERLTEQRRALAVGVEMQLKTLAAAVAEALPTQPVKAARTKARRAPRLDRDRDPKAMERARGLLAFLADTRTTSVYGGFGSMRNGVIEALGVSLDQYVEDLLETLHEAADLAPEERGRALAFLEAAAEFLGYVREPKAAEIVRRRAAAA